VTTILAVFVADLPYGQIDPRAGNEGSRETYSRGGSAVGTVVAGAQSLVRTVRKVLSPTWPKRAVAWLSGWAEQLPERLARTRRSLETSMSILLADWRSRVALAIFSAIIVMGTLGVVLVPAPETSVEQRWLLPGQNWQYPLGTDAGGRGIFSQIVHATPLMLKMVAAGGLFTVFVGTAVGTLSGYVGGAVDRVLMTITDSLMTIPGLPLVIVITFFVPTSSPIVIGIILAVNNWTGLARMLRSEVLSLRNISYVEASRTMGVSRPKIIQRDILPNLMPLVAVSFNGASRRIIFEAVGLYYLGVLSSTGPNWGVMINTAYSQGGSLSLDAAHWLFSPMIVIALFGLGAIMLAQGADRIFNPRIRTRESSGTTSEDEDVDVTAADF
jgi:peptide/nickel transport system permease protein